MNKTKFPELHNDVKIFISRRLEFEPMTKYDRERLSEIREDILGRISVYKQTKKHIIQQEQEHDSLVEWVSKNNINLNIDENGK